MKSMLLADLLADYPLPKTIANLIVGDLRLDSRLINPGDIFICLGADAFIPNAIAAGAVAVLCEAATNDNFHTEYSLEDAKPAPIIFVPQLKNQLSAFAAVRYGCAKIFPPIVGITGTNGKSTLVSLIAQLLSLVKPNSKVATIGTLGVGVHGKQLNFTGMTTPDLLTNYKYMADFAEAKVSVVTMEVSSHGLDQGRVLGLPIKTAVFTNLTQDHLDYHRTLTAYANAKKQLFTMPSIRHCIINADDPFSNLMADAAHNSQIFFYGLNANTQQSDHNYIFAKNIKATSNGTIFEIFSPWGKALVKSPLYGKFNVYNCLAAICAAVLEGVNFQEVVALIPQLKPVLGRMQLISGSDQVQVIVDFAHTPDALEQTLTALKSHTLGRLWVVFGCGGNRDKQKRALMGAIAEDLADEVVLTSDNPRYEDPNIILQDIASGCKSASHIIVDRKEAIEYALTHAQAGDCVLIAGKGHEEYQLIQDTKIPFSDISVATQVLKILALETLDAANKKPMIQQKGGL